MLPARLNQPIQGWGLLAQKAAGFCCTHEQRVSIRCFPYHEILEVVWETLPGSSPRHGEIGVFVVARLEVEMV